MKNVQEIELGKYQSNDTNGTLKEIFCVEYVGNIAFRSIHHKIIVDGSNDEILIKIIDGKLVDCNDSEWTPIKL